MLIRGFIAHLPQDGRVEETPHGLRVAEWGRREGWAIIRSGYVLAFQAFGGPGGLPTPGVSGSANLLHVLPGAAASSVTRELDLLPPGIEGMEAWARRRVDFFNLLRVEPSGLRLLSDPLGLFPYWVGQVEGGIVLSSSIHCLFSAFPELVRPVDPLGMAQYLTGGKGTRTVHARVRSAASGTTVRWSKADGLVMNRERRFQPVPQQPDLRTKDAITNVVELLAEKLEAFVDRSEEVILPLTGGFDSRLMACLIKELGVPCQTVTLGLPHHTEVKVARRIAKILGLPHRLLTPRGELLDRVPLWLQVHEGQAGFGTAFITEMLDRGFPKGAPLLHGLIGGNLVWGAFYTAAETDGSADSIARFLVGKALAELHEDFPETLGLPVGRESFLEELAPNLVEASTPVQTFVIWDLEHRQPRGTGAQIPYLGQEYRAGAPFYDQLQFDAWMAIPRMGLEDRALVRKVFETRFPAVASIPHSEEPSHRLPNNLASLRHQTGEMALRAQDRVFRRMLPGHERRIEDRYIWKLWHRRSDGEIARQFETLRGKRDAVESVLGWAPEGTGGEEFWTKVAKTPRKAEGIRTSYYLLTEYCDWLKRTIPGV